MKVLYTITAKNDEGQLVVVAKKIGVEEIPKAYDKAKQQGLKIAYIGLSLRK